MAAPKKETEAPLFTPKLIVTLLILAIGSGAVAYHLNQKPPKVDPHANNPNVFRMRPIPKKQWKAEKLPKQNKYIERYVFPYIKKNQKPITTCYFQYTGKEKLPPKGGTITYQFEIQKDGSLKNLIIFKAQIKVKSIQRCIAAHIQKWKFAPHTYAKPIRHQTPFFFRR